MDWVVKVDGSPHKHKHTRTHARTHAHTHTHTHNRLTALFPGVRRWAGTRKVKPIWILLKQESVSGSGISWAICKSAPRSRQTTMPAPHHSVFYTPDALPATQPTASKHWRHFLKFLLKYETKDALLQISSGSSQLIPYWTSCINEASTS